MITAPRLARLLPAIFLLTILPPTAAAQVIQVKTIPVAAGEQFLIEPSETRGMASVSVAIDDPLLDPFRNPALGSLTGESRVFAAPAYHSIANRGGSARTLPLGGIFAGRHWFGSAAFALQELHSPIHWRTCCIVYDAALTSSVVPSEPPSQDATTNLYGTASLGRRLGAATAAGVGVTHARLRGVEGVGLLYPSSESMRQRGGISAVRLGLTHVPAEDQRVDLLLVHQRTDLTHEVRYVDVSWTPDWIPVTTHRVEVNHDRTTVWGAQAGYSRRLDDEGWRGGLRGTVNRMTHPATGGHGGADGSGDGHTWAFDLGAGLGRREGPLRLGAEVAWEPIRSRTWSEAPATIASPGAGLLTTPVGTLENDFRFQNAHVRLGAGREERLGFQLGLHIRSISYTLDQYDSRIARRREQKESWMEWTPTWGLSLHFPEIEVRYSGRYVSGTGRPQVPFAVTDAATLAPSFIVAPSGPLMLGEAGVLSHRMTVSFPIRGGR